MHCCWLNRLLVARNGGHLMHLLGPLTPLTGRLLVSPVIHSRSRETTLPAITLFPTQAGNTPIALVDPLTCVRCLRWIKSIAGGGTGYIRPDGRAMPSGVDATSASCCCGLMSRSRGLHCSAELQRVLSSMDKQTLEKAVHIGATEIVNDRGINIRSLVGHILLKCPDKSLEKEFGSILWRERVVVFFSAADKDLLIAVAQPTKAKYAHEDAMKGVTRVHTLHLLPPKNPPPQQGNVAADSGDQQGGDDEAKKKPRYEPFDVYSVENGIEMLKKLENVELTKFVDGLAKFVDRALVALHQELAATSMNPHEVLKMFFPASKTLTVSGDPRYVAALEFDWKALCKRHVDSRYGTGKFDTSAILFDMGGPRTWSNNANIPVLIGGESGSGKTLEMICGNREKSHLVIYMRFDYVLMKQHASCAELCEIICNNDDILRSIAPSDGAVLTVTAEEEAARNKRNSAFATLTKQVVVGAIDNSCALLFKALKGHKKQPVKYSEIVEPPKEVNSDKKFTVRLCFDEMGSTPAFVRACCALDVTELREALGWGDLVEIFVIAAGTGIGSVTNPGGSENTFYQLAMLKPWQSVDVYWKIRRRLWEDWNKHSGRARFSFHALVSDVAAVEELWHGSRESVSMAMEKRNKTLSKLFMAQATHERSQLIIPPQSTEELDAAALTNIWVRQALVQEALFAAIESDGACAAALTNPRMAALFVSVVHAVRDETLTYQLSAATSGTNIRRTVLQRVVMLFRDLNGLKNTTAQEASALLVESLRYVLFDGHVSTTYDTDKLISGRGVMVDNATYEMEVPAACAAILTDRVVNGERQPNTTMIGGIDSNGKKKKGVKYTACYPKELGRYSISPAMVVVLTTLMSNAFEENFSNVGDVFERDMAKFLYFTVQAFHGRPVRELVDFIVGPLASVGKEAQEILKRNTTVEFSTVGIRIAGDDKNDKYHNRLWLKSDGTAPHAWIEISPPGLPSADVVLHIPNVITLPVQCKDRGSMLSHHEIAKAMNSMLIERKRWRDPDPSNSYVFRTEQDSYAKALQEVDRAFEDAQYVRKERPRKKKDVDYGFKLDALGAPVIPILYIAHALALPKQLGATSGMTWDHLDAVGNHCILAEVQEGWP
ncbi:Hypothetical protein, putative [Bodo saltans]|uniref:Uncharacterized protein n=1 Tax=Bodo saltans TaxID=75058 RepID=A0A0S4J052_BODSA|nr:Hypothetical protein, putative [Bodo saltans]|eukprot:CUG74170.1 Hypothetical protein, putative [Bodo saltans]